MTNQTRNIAEKNAALPTPPIIGISMTEPATDRRLNWPDDLSILLKDLQTIYTDTDSVIGRAGYLFREVYDLRTEEGEELAQLQSEWRERTPIHALKLTMFRNDIKSAFVARREVVPVNADILVDLAVQLDSLCVVVTEEKLEQFWTSLFALDREIATLAQAVSLRNHSSVKHWSNERSPKTWQKLLEEVDHFASATQWRNYRKKYVEDMTGPAKKVRITKTLAAKWGLQLPDFGEPAR